MRRRGFLVSLCALCVCRQVPFAAAPQREEFRGCALERGLGSLSDTTARSGNVQLDRAMIAEVKKVDRIFGINPGYRFLRDGDRPNAYATEESQVTGTSGTILFGLTLMQSELRTEYGGAAMAGIAAHEGAHIFQFNTNDIRQRLNGPTQVRMELHADFMAGYYFARTKRTERSLVTFAESLFAKGDYQFNERGHHGTPDQRVASMRAGYGSLELDLLQAANRGVQHVTNV